jgi:hypothetical protein
MVKYLATATCYFVNSDTEKQFPSFEDACKAAEEYCGNTVFAQPIAREKTRMYGPGDGTTSVMVRQDIDWSKLVAPTNAS